MKITVHKYNFIKSIEFCCYNMSNSVTKGITTNFIISISYNDLCVTINYENISLQYCPFCGSKIEILSD